MTYQMRDKDIDEIYLDPQNGIIHITYLGATEGTFYTRADILKLLDIIDGKTEGVKIL